MVSFKKADPLTFDEFCLREQYIKQPSSLRWRIVAQGSMHNFSLFTLVFWVLPNPEIPNNTVQNHIPKKWLFPQHSTKWTFTGGTCPELLSARYNA